VSRSAFAALLLASVSLAACDGGLDGKDQPLPGSEQAANAPAKSPAAKPPLQVTKIAFSASDVDAAAYSAEAAASADRTPAILRAQVLLDRARFRPGVIDGKMGENVRQAIAAFESANGLTVDGQMDEAVFAKLTEMDTGSALARYTIQPADVAGPFQPEIPSGLEEQAALPALSYTSALEGLGESST
jgi:peptidoglycan hydrolase-like protein with peptidoglycan-binding domain